MGGRGASSGISESGRKYGTEFTTLLQEGNIKFVKYNDANNAKDPLETMTRGSGSLAVKAHGEDEGFHIGRGGGGASPL